MKTVEIKASPDPTPGFIRYLVYHDGHLAAAAEAAPDDTDLMAEVLERAVEGLFREGRPWEIR